jgi:hypothetical protein
MKYKKFNKEKYAIAGVIEALLLIGLVAIILSIIQLHYIPKIMEQKEAEHMDEVSNQFSYLKNMIDIQAMAGTMGNDISLAHAPIMTQITLGSKGLPYFITVPSYGELRIKNNGARIYGNSIDVNFSSIVYHAHNLYFVEQTYVLEGGGIILNQSTEEGSVMRVDPSISVKDMDNWIEMKFYLPNIIEVPGKNFTSGYGGCYIRTNYSSYQRYLSDPIAIGNCIVIYSNYLSAWNESFNRLFKDINTDPNNKVVDVSITQYKDTNVMKITPLRKPINLELTLVNINCQIGPGWVI